MDKSPKKGKRKLKPENAVIPDLAKFFVLENSTRFDFANPK
jgi:hypothetical protein